MTSEPKMTIIGINSSGARVVKELTAEELAEELTKEQDNEKTN